MTKYIVTGVFIMNVLGDVKRVPVMYEYNSVNEAMNTQAYMDNNKNYECVSGIFTVVREQ